MAFKVFPTSVAGVQLPFNQLKGPLSKLWNKETFPNYYFPQDIGNNPAHCHVVQISIFEYTTDFEQKIADPAAGIISGAFNDTKGTIDQAKKTIVQSGEAITNIYNNKDLEKVKEGTAAGIDALGTLYSAKTYKTKPGGNSLANISLYMPDSLSVDYNATYSDINLTQTLGIGGLTASALSELGGAAGILAGKTTTDLTKTAFAKQAGIKALSTVGGALPGVGDVSPILGQALHQIVNPQIQLMYQSVGLREFQLDFIFTPKSSYEADSVKKIIDTLVYYSSPGIAGQNTQDQQQYLVPPQLFNIKFLFTGKNGVVGALGSAFNKAFTNIGLDFLTSDQNKLSVNADQNINTKLFNIGDCVLTDISLDYAPNGWAAFDDGHPVQTKMSLKFKEINIMTKQRLKATGNSTEIRTPEELAYTKSLGNFNG